MEIWRIFKWRIFNRYFKKDLKFIINDMLVI